MTNKLKKYSKIEISIYILTVLQIISYIFLAYVNYKTGHDDNPSDYDWMGEIFPAAIFVIFGTINLLCFIIYLYNCYVKKIKPKATILISIITLALLYVFMNPVIDYFYYLNR